MNKLFKRLIALALSLSVVAPACVFAYTPGPKEYTYEFDELISASNAVIESSGLRIGAGGSASMDLLLPFTTGKMHFEYAAAKDTSITINTGRNTYTALLSKDETAAAVEVHNEEVADLILTLSADAEVFISSLVFEKFDADISPSNINATPVFSAVEEALLTAVAIGDNSVALFDHGAMRYLDFNNTRTAPKYFDGALYIPAFALARALDMYIEDYQELEYVFLRSIDEKIEIYYEKGEAYHTTAGKKSKIDLAVKYQDGLTWLPVKQVAELAEKTVISKNGVTVIDFKLNARNIVNDSGVFSELQKKLNRFALKDNSGGITYHVAKTKNANDRNPGTEEMPFRTVSRAAELVKPGDTVIVHEGIYSEVVKPKNSGTPSKPIRFIAADGEEVIMSNTIELSGFAKYDDKIWCVEVPEKVGIYRLQVFHEGKALTQGRHPNTHNREAAVPYHASTNEQIFGVHGDIVVGNEQPTEAIARSLAGKYFVKSDSGLLDQEEKDYWKGATWTGLKGAGWYLSVAPVTGSEKGKAFIDDGGWKQASVIYFNKNYAQDWGFLSNHIHTVDMPGEWYYDGTTLYIIPPEGVDGKDLTVSVKQGFTSFDLTDKSFIEIHNINTRAASITMAGKSEHNVLNGGTHEYVSFATFVGLNGTYGRGYEQYNENALDGLKKGAAGIFIEGENNAILNAKILNTATHAIFVNHPAKYAFMYNNEIGNAGYAYGDAGVQILAGRSEYFSGGHQFIGNTIYSCGAHCLDTNNSGNVNTVYPLIPMEIAYNHMYEGTQYSRDSGLVYMHYGHYGNDREFTQVHHNLVHDSLVTHTGQGATSVIGIYFDNSTSGIDAHNNLIYWKDIEHTLTPVYVQRKGAFPQTYSTVPTYANKSLGYIKEDINMKTLSEMPNGKPFAVGATHASNGRFFENGKFLGNYESYKINYDTMLATEATLTDGAYLTEDGYAVFGNTGKITFKNVDLTGKNNIVAYIAGNEKVSDYVLRLEVIKDGEVVESDPVAVMLTSENYDGSNEVGMRIMDFEGKHDVVLHMNNSEDAANELRLIRMKVEHTDAEPVLPTGAAIVYGGDFTESIWNTSWYMNTVSNYNLSSRYETRTHFYANYVFENTVIYRDVKIEKDYTDLIAMIQADTGEGQEYYMQIRIGSETAPPIAEFCLDFVPEIEGGREVTGYVWRKLRTKLPEGIKAGTYDFYLTFEDRNNVKEDGKDADTCDIAYFGFYNESEQSVK